MTVTRNHNLLKSIENLMNSYNFIYIYSNIPPMFTGNSLLQVNIHITAS